MGNHDVVGNNPRLGRALMCTNNVSFMPFGVERMDLRSESTHTVTESGNTPRLVEGQPMLDPIAKPLETESGVSHKVFGAFFLVQPSSVVVVQCLGQIPTIASALVYYIAMRRTGRA